MSWGLPAETCWNCCFFRQLSNDVDDNLFFFASMGLPPETCCRYSAGVNVTLVECKPGAPKGTAAAREIRQDEAGPCLPRLGISLECVFLPALLISIM